MYSQRTDRTARMSRMYQMERPGEVTLGLMVYGQNGHPDGERVTRFRAFSHQIWKNLVEKTYLIWSL